MGVYFLDMDYYLVSYGRLKEICVVLSWASQSQVPVSAFPSLPKFPVECCSFLAAALSGCSVMLAGVEEVSELGWGRRLLRGLERRCKANA